MDSFQLVVEEISVVATDRIAVILSFRKGS